MKNRNSFLYALVASFFLAIAGCGGGGGGSTPPSPSTTVIPTTIPTATPIAVPTTYTVNAIAELHGSVSPSGDMTVTQGDNKIFTLTPELDYLCNIAINGNAPTAVPSCVYTLTNVQANMTIRAVFTTRPVPLVYDINVVIEGGVTNNVTLTTSPGGYTCTTSISGTCTMSVPNGITYTVTPSHSSNPTFTPGTLGVMIDGANLSAKFTTPLPVLAVWTTLYPCFNAFCTQDLSKRLLPGEGITAIWPLTPTTASPREIVPARRNGIILVGGINMPCILKMSIANPNPVCAVRDYSYFYFDISEYADYAVLADWIVDTPGFPGKYVINMYKTDGLGYTLSVADGLSPIFCSVVSPSGDVDICYINSGSIWKQTMNVITSLKVGSPIMLVGNAMSGERALSATPDYSHLVFVKNANSVSVITKMPIAGGAEVALGIGRNPHCTLDGSNKVIYSNIGKVYAVDIMGGGKAEVPIASNFQGYVHNVVFGSGM